MSLHSLFVKNLRIIEDLEFSLAEDATVFCGENGAGKTSILEAVDFLSRGRSFRSRCLEPLLRRGTEVLTVRGEVKEAETTTHLGIQKSANETILHRNRQKVASISEHANYLPVVSLHPDCHQLIQGGARYRRSYLDWSTFHVKQGFLFTWRKYKKCLRQRNSVLRRGVANKREVSAWTQELSISGEVLDQARSKTFEEIVPIFKEYNNKLLPECQIDLTYKRGWPSGASLQEALEQASRQEQQYKTTQFGPHRAELAITMNNQPAHMAASRGQQKLIAACLMLAQIDHAHQHSDRKCVVLLDDIRAELDDAHAQALFKCLQALNSQVVISTIEPEQVDLVGWENSKTFHVKQGSCKLLS